VFKTLSGGFFMATYPIVSRPFPRGLTAKGEEILILTWRDLECFSHMQVKGEWYRTYCPIHGREQERSLAIKSATGFGHCFGCDANVFVAEFDPSTAKRLQRRRYGTVFPHQKQEYSPIPTPSRQKKPLIVCETALCEKQTEEWQLLSKLQAQGALDLDRETAWNAQAYLEARHISLEVARRVGVTYVAPEAAHEYGEWIRPWEDRLLFPLTAPGGEVGFIGRLITYWQCCCDAAAHQARLRAEKLEPWRKTGRGWFWDPLHLPSSEPIVVVDGPFDRLAVLSDGVFEPGEVVALAGMTFHPAWLSQIRAILFALNQPQHGKEASERVKQQLAWNGGVRMEMCRPTRGNNWSERWRREGAGGLELLYVHHTLLKYGL
jgi:hypothetical protein